LEKFPANNVTWTGADAYCKFMGLRLPREAEWEKSARGTDGREFPWGNEDADETRARYSQRWKEKKFNVMVPVDGLPKGVGPYGTYNQAGNVWEWCLDEFPHPEPGARYKVLRGGGWNFNPLLCRCPYRSVNKHDFRNSGYGFRPFKSV
jgi:serine/threonine-protein kinase